LWCWTRQRSFRGAKMNAAMCSSPCWGTDQCHAKPCHTLTAVSDHSIGGTGVEPLRRRRRAGLPPLTTTPSISRSLRPINLPPEPYRHPACNLAFRHYGGACKDQKHLVKQGQWQTGRGHSRVSSPTLASSSAQAPVSNTAVLPAPTDIEPWAHAFGMAQSVRDRTALLPNNRFR